MAEIIGVGIPWYERDDYARILEVMDDADLLPRSYNEWKKRAEEAVGMVIERGYLPVRVPIDPEKFRTWCMLRGENVDARARQNFASDPSNWPNKH